MINYSVKDRKRVEKIKPKSDALLQVTSLWFFSCTVSKQIKCVFSFYCWNSTA